LRQRREWFEQFSGIYLALWWVPRGHMPSIDEAKKRLAHLEEHGPSQFAFNFKNIFPPDAQVHRDLRLVDVQTLSDERRLKGAVPAFPTRKEDMSVSKSMNPVVHFEMPAGDRKRMAEFYTKAFGWQTQMLGPDMGDYVVVTTTESDKNGPKKPGAINGGFYPKKEDWPAQNPSVVIAVDDIKASMNKVAEAGGKVLGEPMEIPGVGQYVSFFDTEGNRVSLLQPLPRMAVRPKSR